MNKTFTRRARLKLFKFAADIEIKKLIFQVIDNGKIPYALYNVKTCYRHEKACKK